MKRLIKLSSYITVLIMAIALLTACSSCNTQKDLTNATDEPMIQTFDTAQEAIAQAKEDMLEVLTSNKEIDLGISADDLQSASAGSYVQQNVIGFEDLMQADSSTTFNDLMESEMSKVVPFMNNSRVVAVAEIAKDDAKWKISGLANQAISRELDVVQRASGSNGQVKIHHIPNLNATVYEVNNDGDVSYHTAHGGRSLRQAYSQDQLIPDLAADARRFWDQYGNQLQQGQLVK